VRARREARVRPRSGSQGDGNGVRPRWAKSLACLSAGSAAARGARAAGRVRPDGGRQTPVGRGGGSGGDRRRSEAPGGGQPMVSGGRAFRRRGLTAMARGRHKIRAKGQKPEGKRAPAPGAGARKGRAGAGSDPRGPQGERGAAGGRAIGSGWNHSSSAPGRKRWGASRWGGGASPRPRDGGGGTTAGKARRTGDQPAPGGPPAGKQDARAGGCEAHKRRRRGSSAIIGAGKSWIPAWRACRTEPQGQGSAHHARASPRTEGAPRASAEPQAGGAPTGGHRVRVRHEARGAAGGRRARPRGLRSRHGWAQAATRNERGVRARRARGRVLCTCQGAGKQAGVEAKPGRAGAGAVPRPPAGRPGRGGAGAGGRRRPGSGAERTGRCGERARELRHCVVSRDWPLAVGPAGAAPQRARAGIGRGGSGKPKRKAALSVAAAGMRLPGATGCTVMEGADWSPRQGGGMGAGRSGPAGQTADGAGAAGERALGRTGGGRRRGGGSADGGRVAKARVPGRMRAERTRGPP